MKNLSRDEAAERAALLRVESYEVRLDLTAAPSATRFGTGTRVVFECRRDGADTFVEHEVPVWESAVLDGVPLDLGTVAGNRLPLRGLSAGRHELEVRAVADYSVTGEGLHRFVDPADGEVYLYAQSFLDDAQRIFACFDQPDLKAPITLTVQAPADWVVGGNTRGRPGTARSWVFAPTEPISTYLFTLAAGPYHVRAGRARRHRAGPVVPAVAARTTSTPTTCSTVDPAVLRPASRSCSAGRYPFGDSYDQVFVPEFNAGAMENAGMVTFSDDFLFRSAGDADRRRLRATVVAHEMAHMWFGDLVTMRWWDDLWLNESFAELHGLPDRRTRRPGFAGAWAAFCRRPQGLGLRAPTSGRPRTRSPAEVADTPQRAAQLRRHLLRQGRLGAAPAGGAGSATRRVLRRRAGLPRPARLRQRRRWPTCSPRSSAAAAGTCRPGPTAGCARPGSTRCGRSGTARRWPSSRTRRTPRIAPDRRRPLRTWSTAGCAGAT